MNAQQAPGLVRYEAAKYALQLARDIDEVKDIRDKAQAMAAYARQAKDTQLVEWATEIKVRAERRAGEMLAGMEKQHGARGTGKKVESHDDIPLLVDLGISANQSSRWQKLAAVPEDKFEQAVAAAKKIAGEVTTAALLRLNSPRNEFTGEIEWYTPVEYIEAARSVMGEIDLDPASSDAAQRVVRATQYLTAEDDGLAQKWAGRVWLNPPYGEHIGEFVAKLTKDFALGSVTDAILLTHNSCDTGWWHQAHCSCAGFVHTRGRINFTRSDGFTASPPLGQTFFYFGLNRSGFFERFTKFGCASIPFAG